MSTRQVLLDKSGDVFSCMHVGAGDEFPGPVSCLVFFFFLLFFFALSKQSALNDLFKLYFVVVVVANPVTSYSSAAASRSDSAASSSPRSSLAINTQGGAMSKPTTFARYSSLRCWRKPEQPLLGQAVERVSIGNFHLALHALPLVPKMH